MGRGEVGGGMRARENANRFSEGCTVQQRTSFLGSSLCEVKM